jgi:ABC-type lipoprotein export system ATPase subunit
MKISPSLTCHQIEKRYSSAHACIDVLHTISYTFAPGTSYALTGASGSGKSTFLYLLAGLEALTAGEIRYGDRLIAHQDDSFLLQHIGIVLQEPVLLQELTVSENMALKGMAAGWSLHARSERTRELLAFLGMEELAHRYPRHLSGGQQQRVALGRALFLRPSFLLADEPTAHLDEQNKESLLLLLKNAQKTWGMGTIIATHDPGVAAWAHVILHIKNGSLVQ